ncbi:MAG: NAD(P)-binding protein [Labilithrix sp.]|nr:NAD(P)-binding protein [Labilithrix sp.]
MDLSRRDLLAAFLGVPLATAAAGACKSKKRVPDGELAFRPEELGHRVRDERPPAIPEDKWERTGIAIVGAGVAGLSAARTLLAAGYEDFVILELESAPGGTARAGSNATSAYPWGAHYVTAPMSHNVDFIALLRELDLVEGVGADGEPIFREEAMCREPQERVYADGAWHEGLYLHAGASDEDKAQWRRFRETVDRYATMRDGKGRRAFSVPVALGSDDAELTALDKLSMGDWLAREGFTSPRLRWIVDYACRDDFGARASQTSAWAGIHYYASRLLGAGREPQAVLTWPAGNGWLVGKLFDKVRAKARFGLAVADVTPTSRDGKPIVEVVAVGRPPAAVGFRAEQVVFAAPQLVARRVVRPFRDAPPAHLGAFEYGAWMVANITLSGRPKPRRRGEHPFAWDNVLYDSPSLGYVVATHQTGRDHGPTVITYYHPLCDDDPRAARRRLYDAGRDAWADVALTDLEAAHPDIRELATRVDVARWGHAMVRPAPGFMFGGARALAARPERGIHFAHTELSGVALFEEAFHHGTRAATAALAAIRGGTPT